MASVDSQQVTLSLTNDKNILAALKKRKALKRDEQGDKLVIQFDGQSFEFRPGIKITVGKSVGESLFRSSTVIVGDDLTGEVKAALNKTNPVALGHVSEEEQRRATICPVCRKEQFTLKRLANHLSKAHVEDRPDLYADPRPSLEGAEPDTDELEFDENSGAIQSAKPTAVGVDEDAE